MDIFYEEYDIDDIKLLDDETELYIAFHSNIYDIENIKLLDDETETELLNYLKNNW